MKNDKLLIVGGTGFIGRNVAREAISRGLQVTIISKSDYSPDKRLKGVEYISVDITNEKILLSKLKDKPFDYVLNVGGYVNHANYFNDGDKVFKVHFNGTKNLVNCINKSGLKSFVQIGSSDEYGKNSAPQNENQRELPISPYSFAKVAATHFLQMLHRTEGFPAVILRPFLVYGPEQDGNRFIPQIIKGCINNDNFPTSAGEQQRDFCYIDDIVDVILLALSNEKAHGEVINIASGEPITIRETINIVQKIVGYGKPEFGKIPYRKCENMTLFADISKAKELLKWTPEVAIEDGLQRTINYQILNTESQ